MPDGANAEDSLGNLNRALVRLENAADRRIERQRDLTGTEEEVQRLDADRMRLAGELDRSKSEADRLAQANRDVSHRLVAAMETIRTVLDR